MKYTLKRPKNWFFEKMNKIDKLLDRLKKKERLKPIKQEKRSYDQYQRNTKIVRDYYEPLHMNKVNNLLEIKS